MGVSLSTILLIFTYQNRKHSKPYLKFKSVVIKSQKLRDRYQSKADSINWSEDTYYFYLLQYLYQIYAYSGSLSWSDLI